MNKDNTPLKQAGSDEKQEFSLREAAQAVVDTFHSTNAAMKEYADAKGTEMGPLKRILAQIELGIFHSTIQNLDTVLRGK